MIIEYHRPETIDQALELIARPSPITYPMGGGTKLNRASGQKYAVVDLQALSRNPEVSLGQISVKRNTLVVGAAVTLSDLVESSQIPEALRVALKNETNQHLQNVATVGGTFVSSDGRSAFAAVLCAMDSVFTLVNREVGEITITAGEFMLSRQKILAGSLILTLQIPLQIKVCYQSVSRTPADLPIVAAAVCNWPAGRTRVMLAGYGPAPLLAFDGPDHKGAELAAREAYVSASDAWASAEYRASMAETLTGRCLKYLKIYGV